MYHLRPGEGSDFFQHVAENGSGLFVPLILAREL